MTVYVVLAKRLEPGVYVIIFPLQLKLPEVAGEVEKADWAVAWFIDSLKVTVICEVTGTPVPVGVLSVTIGGDVSETDAVVNCHE